MKNLEMTAVFAVTEFLFNMAWGLLVLAALFTLSVAEFVVMQTGFHSTMCSFRNSMRLRALKMAEL